jgi:hypothetical protein
MHNEIVGVVSNAIIGYTPYGVFMGCHEEYIFKNIIPIYIQECTIISITSKGLLILDEFLEFI